ncbi:glycosyltransferase family 2 protein [Chryseobacterium salivictor]|uniref:Teichoic acid poly(Glycerol phosphate) polymerase n=1 Tax=Chryseobacterium salivictor TaxID=2547600 RepID=A0A4P6ZFI4_9FLAO|nr:glycosyltransferase family 2 protein [Chryseobacterium salivictor]QBO58361.1 Teichoic acid poly(glycerol phosphate) polymerase [Chryseobacterium salivictor]
MQITVFTTTYNRAYILPNLYHSLLRQQTNDFEWLVIDDGSTDETAQLVAGWVADGPFPIRYFKTENGGKPRAINKAVELANTPYLFIIDSDDYLTDDVIPFFLSELQDFVRKPELVGLGIMRGNNPHQPLGSPRFGDQDFIDAPHLERNKYGLNFDCNELYKIEILRQFPFRVWEGELFSPEEIVLYEMDLHGYKVRWYNKVGVISEYLEDGLTVNAFSLLKKNPMGYAMSFNHQLKYKKTFKERFTSAYLMICYTLLGKNIFYLAESNDKLMTVLAFPVGVLVSVRRWWQFRKA